MKLQLTSYDTTYTVETEKEGLMAGELQELFDKMLVLAGFTPNILRALDGQWKWHEE